MTEYLVGGDSSHFLKCAREMPVKAISDPVE